MSRFKHVFVCDGSVEYPLIDKIVGLLHNLASSGLGKGQVDIQLQSLGKNLTAIVSTRHSTIILLPLSDEPVYLNKEGNKNA